MNVEVACDQVGEVYLLKGSFRGTRVGMAPFFPRVDVVESKVGGRGAEAPICGVYVQVHDIGSVVVKTREDRVASAETQGDINGHSGPCNRGCERLKTGEAGEETFAGGGVLYETISASRVPTREPKRERNTSQLPRVLC